MWKLVQGGLSVVAGTAEPEYGPEAIHPVCESLKPEDPIYTGLTHDDLKYVVPEHTNVETQTFYFNDETYFGFAQVIHSNVFGISTTAQFTFKILDKSKPDNYVWTSTHLENFEIVQDGVGFKADQLSIELDETNKSYTITSEVSEESKVSLKFELLGDGVKFGKDGKTIYGTDVNEPWGSMRHIFWPRCKVSGEVKLNSKQTDFSDGKVIKFDSTKNIGMYVMALQGMKPHHAAATWNFLNYVSDDYSTVLMEFTTPKSYSSTLVSVGVTVDKTGKIVLGSIDNKTTFVETTKDEGSGWDIPKKIQYDFKGQGKDEGTEVVVSGELKNLSERVDIMFELPQFVKNIVGSVAGTKPYIYQFSNDLKLKLIVGGEVKKEETGYAYTESSFVTEA